MASQRPLSAALCRFVVFESDFCSLFMVDVIYLSFYSSLPNVKNLCTRISTPPAGTSKSTQHKAHSRCSSCNTVAGNVFRLWVCLFTSWLGHRKSLLPVCLSGIKIRFMFMRQLCVCNVPEKPFISTWNYVGWTSSPDGLWEQWHPCKNNLFSLNHHNFLILKWRLCLNPTGKWYSLLVTSCVYT